MATSGDDHRAAFDAPRPAPQPGTPEAQLAVHMDARHAMAEHLVDTAGELLASARRLAGRAPMVGLEEEMRAIAQRLAELEHQRVHHALMMRVR